MSCSALGYFDGERIISPSDRCIGKSIATPLTAGSRMKSLVNMTALGKEAKTEWLEKGKVQKSYEHPKGLWEI